MAEQKEISKKKMPRDYRGDKNWKPKPKSGIPAQGSKVKIPANKMIHARNTKLMVLPKTIKEINALGDELIVWAEKNTGAFSLNGFALSKKYSPYKVNQLAKKSKYFADCLELARYILLYGMEIRVLEAEKVSHFAYQWMRDHHRWWDKDYAQHYKDMIELRKQSKDENKGSDRVIYQEVVIPDFGTSGMVPDKPKEDDES